MTSRRHQNPYIAGGTVKGAEMFFGREDIFSFIQRNLIGRHQDTPIVLYGQRRTGKTSVLYQLHRYLDPNYRCILIDLHGLPLDSMGNLLLGLANAISRGLERDHQLTVRVPDRAFFRADPRAAFETTFLEELWPVLGEYHLVLMMDEVVRLQEEITAGRLQSEIFEFLRHLMQHHTRLNFIFSLGSGLEEMEKQYAFLFNVSLYHRISFLETIAATELITHPARDCYQVTPEAVEKILHITSGHAYYTQLLCHCMFDRWIRSPKPAMTVEDVDAVLAEAIELGSANLKYVWEESAPEEQALMSGMAAAMRTVTAPVTVKQIRKAWRGEDVSLFEPDIAKAIRSLTNREVITGDQAYSFAVDLQRLWLEKHRRLDWMKDELPQELRGRPRASKISFGKTLVAAVVAAAIALAAAGYLVGKHAPPSAPGAIAAAQFIYTARTANDAAITLPGAVQNELLQIGLDHQSIALTRVGFTGRVSTSSIDLTPRTGDSPNDPPLGVSGRAVPVVDAKISGIEKTINSSPPNATGGRALYAGLTKTDFAGTPVTIVSSGLDLANPDNFRALNWSVPPEELVADLKKANALPALHGPVTFVLVPTAGPQPQLGQAQKSYLKAVWAALLAAGGATSVTFIDATGGTTPSSVAPRAATVPVPGQPTTPIPPAGKTKYKVTCTVPASYFIVNTPRLIDAAKAKQNLTPCIRAALAAHATFALDGWTSYAGPLTANGKPAINDPYNRRLSQARVQAIASLLVNDLAVPRSAITHLVGHGNVNQPNPDPASPANRVVVITYTVK